MKVMKERFEELDALRGIAALSVVFFHFTMDRHAYNQFFKLGTTGVDLFFIISGFVIFMSLQRVSKGVDFVINRVSRIYPTYWVSVTFTFILIVLYSSFNGNFQLKKDLVTYLGNLTMFQFYLRIPDLDGPYWTMIIEMIFYISILVLFQIKALRYLNMIGVVLCLAVVLATRFFWDISYVRYLIWGIPLLQFLPLFFAGTIFYKLYTQKKHIVLYYTIISFCLVCQLLLFPYAGRSRTFISQNEYNFVVISYFLLFILFVNNLLRFIVNSVTLFLGKISFALYLIHQFVSLTILIPYFHEKLGIDFWTVCILIDLPVIIGIAALITYKFEVPYSRKMKEKLRLIAYSPKQ